MLAAQKVIDIRDLTFRYGNSSSNLVLNIPKWSILQNEQVFLYGCSGAGKSTLLNLISGLFCADSGEITVLNHPLHSMNRSQKDKFRAIHLGYIFQQFNLIPYLNSIDNVLLSPYFARKNSNNKIISEIKELFYYLNINENDWSKPTQQLSIGQQQRIAIVRALINKPDLIIADEPTSSLDAENRDLFISKLLSISSQKNMTLLFVSHDFALSKYFSRIENLQGISTGNKH